MTKAEAKQDACELIYGLIENYFDVGQPHEDCQAGISEGKYKHTRRGDGDDDCPDCNRVIAALKELQGEMARRGHK